MKDRFIRFPWIHKFAITIIKTKYETSYQKFVKHRGYEKFDNQNLNNKLKETFNNSTCFEQLKLTFE